MAKKNETKKEFVLLNARSRAFNGIKPKSVVKVCEDELQYYIVNGFVDIASSEVVNDKVKTDLPDNTNDVDIIIDTTDLPDNTNDVDAIIDSL